MRLLLLFEPGFAVALVALVSRFVHEPTGRVAFGIGLLVLLALLPATLLLRRGAPALARNAQKAQKAEAAEDV